ncbi:superoxide dismutase [Gorgonomyces haynaldii]|nr:superoxide dismutase [Gorgonomyces haynaldii]
MLLLSLLSVNAALHCEQTYLQRRRECQRYRQVQDCLRDAQEAYDNCESSSRRLSAQFEEHYRPLYRPADFQDNQRDNRPDDEERQEFGGKPDHMVFKVRKAQVKLVADQTNPNSTNVNGVVYLEQPTPRSQTKIKLVVSGLLPRTTHGWHFHEFGIIFPNCTSAGLHFNPFNVTHGDRLAKVRHVGDLGNFESDADGKAELEFEDRLVSLWGRRSVIGRTLVIHQNKDDLGLTDNPQSKTVGNSGSRLSCGVVGLAL